MIASAQHFSFDDEAAFGSLARLRRSNGLRGYPRRHSGHDAVAKVHRLPGKISPLAGEITRGHGWQAWHNASVYKRSAVLTSIAMLGTENAELNSLLIFAAAMMPFNLVCTGEASHIPKMLAPPENVRPIRTTYRVDLEAQRWCQDGCSSVTEIAKITETEIIFVLETPKSEDDWNDYYEYVSRDTGVWGIRRRITIGDVPSVDLVAGRCSRAKFTRFLE